MSEDWQAQAEVLGIGVGGIAIDARIHRAAEEQAMLLLVHGFGEHSGRYRRQVEYLNARGITVVTYDLRAHGRTAGARGRASVAEHVRDLQVLRDAVDERFRGAVRPDGASLPSLLMGHSMGGLIAAESAVQRPWGLHGLVLSSPGLEVGMETPDVLKKVAPVVGKALPFLPVEKLDANAISRVPEYVENYRKDRLVHTAGVPAKAAGSMLADGERMLRRARSLRVPTLLLHGSGDTITGVDGARRFALDAGADVGQAQIVTYREFEGGYHELFNDLCADEVYAALGAWLDEVGV